MVLPPGRRWLAAVLLLAVVAPEAFPVALARHRCACGMVVGCCCLRQAEMKAAQAGDHCVLRRPSRDCAVKPVRDLAAEMSPTRGREGRLGTRPSDGLRLPLPISGTLADFDDSPPEIPRPAPPVPPPRFIPAV
jgi:hypothetical protein